MNSFLLSTGIACVCLAAPLVAQPTAASDQSATQQAAETMPAATTPESQTHGAIEPADRAGTGWEFVVTPYLWASSSKTELRTRQGEQVKVKDSFFDILGDLKFAFMGASEARHGRLVLLGDLMYISLGSSGDGHVGPIPLSADVKEKTLLMTGLVGYRAIDRGPMFLDLLAGARLSGLKTDVELTGPFETRRRDFKKTHLGPVVASRFRAPLGGKWGAAVYGDLGGFGIGSAFSWQLMGTVQYDLSRHWQLGAGWRHLYLRGKDNGFTLKQTLDGPIVTISYRM